MATKYLRENLQKSVGRAAGMVGRALQVNRGRFVKRRLSKNEWPYRE